MLSLHCGGWFENEAKDIPLHTNNHLLSHEACGVDITPFLPLTDSGCIHNGSSDSFDEWDVLHGNIVSSILPYQRDKSLLRCILPIPLVTPIAIA